MGTRTKAGKAVRPTPPPSAPALVHPTIGVLALALGGTVAVGCRTPGVPPMPPPPMPPPTYGDGGPPPEPEEAPMPPPDDDEEAPMPHPEDEPLTKAVEIAPMPAPMPPPMPNPGPTKAD